MTQARRKPPRGEQPGPTKARMPPHDLGAEKALLGAVLNNPVAVLPRVGDISADDFYSPHHKSLWATIVDLYASGQPVDVITIVNHAEHHALDRKVAGELVIDAQVATPAITSAPSYADIIIRCAEARAVLNATVDVVESAYAVNGYIEKADALRNVLRRAVSTTERPIELRALLAEADDDDYRWVVPGLLEEGDRVILTGQEGKGKSTLIRQIAVAVAAGLDPFTLRPIEPVSTLLVDVENSRRQIKRKIRPLEATVGKRYTDGQLHLAVRTNPLNLCDPKDVAWLHAQAAPVNPRLIIIGPIYKLASGAGDPIKEEIAAGVSGALDRLRDSLNCALLIEAHSPYGETSSKRPIRPYGASLWSRWPEFGIYLAPDGKLEHWRGARDEREWPAKLERSNPWPWAVDLTVLSDGDEWTGPTHCQDAIVELLRIVGTELTTNKIAEALRDAGHHYRRQTVLDAAALAATNGLLDVRTGPRGGRFYSTVTGGGNEPLGDF